MKRKKTLYAQDGKLIFGVRGQIPQGTRIIPYHPAHREAYERAFGVKIQPPKPLTDDDRKQIMDAFEHLFSPPKDEA